MGKRTKQYKKLMRSFEFLGFRQPYQVLITSDVLLDTLKIDLVTLTEKVLSTKSLKPMITQCCIRRLYDMNQGPDRDPAVVAAIERAKGFERRRCGHLMDEAAKLERECMMSVVDPKGDGRNKWKYIVMTQDEELRAKLRSVVPTPLMYVKRSVVILEPMADASARVRTREELAKFKAGIVRGPQPQKRKREEGEREEEGAAAAAESSDDDEDGSQGGAALQKTKKKKVYGKKSPNPLAVKKAKKETTRSEKPRKTEESTTGTTGDAPGESKPKRKRRKKAGAATAGGDASGAGTAGAEVTATVMEDGADE